MCGISGLFDYSGAPVDPNVVERMRVAARHRGPDDSGTYCKNNVGLAFNRLSIIDLSGGHQPMSNEDGTVWVIFNGEIYNFLELHADLEARGHRFRTRSDTETIVHAWEEYGEACVEKFRGMFAFVIWDEKAGVLFGARDRLGIKPFYYHDDGRRFAFASEIKSILEIPGIDRATSPSALGEFLRRRYVISPNTMLRNVYKLEPGHTVRVTSAGIKIRRYWDVPPHCPSTASEGETLEQLDALLRECLRMHLVADVPLGSFLSGGLDSSCVVGLMSELGVSDIKTFSIGYDTPESELDYARVVANHFKTDHYELRLTPDGFRDILPKIVWHMDEPVGDTASIPLYYLAQFARKKVTVALSGEGSDEIFAGYQIYSRMLAFERANRIPGMQSFGKLLGASAGDTKVRKYADMLGRPLEWRYGGVGGLFSESQSARLLQHPNGRFDGVARSYGRCNGQPALSRMSYVDLTTWLPDDLLVKADRMSMANALELRVPFLDHKLVEFATTLPLDFKIRNGTTKYLLKKWAEKLLPHEIVHRTKKGFPVPTKSWFRDELSGYARETLLSSGGIVREFLAPSEVEALLDHHRREDRSDQIFSLLALDSWHRQFVRPYAAQSV